MKRGTEIEAGEWIKAEIAGETIEVKVRDMEPDRVWVFLPARLQHLYDASGSYMVQLEDVR